jgi:hypothetical protein
MEQPHIRQIIPATPGWRAIYYTEGSGQEKDWAFDPIICWALAGDIGEEGYETVRAMVQDGTYFDRADAFGNLVTLVGPDATDSDISKLVKEFREEKARAA